MAPIRPEPWKPPTPPLRSFSTGPFVIRAYTPGDAQASFDAVEGSRSTLYPWQPWALNGHLNAAASAAVIGEFEAIWSSPEAPHYTSHGYVCGIFDAGGRLLGGTGFSRILAESHDAETGYWLREDSRGRGVMTQVMRAWITHGLTPQREGGWGFRRIRIIASDANAASCAVPARLGLREEMHARADRWVDGIGWTGTKMWGVLAEEWRAP